MKKSRPVFLNCLLAVFLILNNFPGLSQTVSPRFFSQNAWMPDTIGNAAACSQAPCILYGKLHKKWDLISASGAATVRFGGIAPDRNMPTNFQYIKMIDSIRAKGMEPIIQVPFHNWRYTATQAAQLVQYINVTKGKNIKYWVIGNEPDNEYGYTTAAQVAAYIKPFASAMKNVDPSILLIGPETAWYNTNIINGLTTPGGPDDITGKDATGRFYIDVISFHYYGFNGTQTRQDMLTKIMASSGLNTNLNALNARIASCNSFHNRSGQTALKTAITEANVNWQNPSTDNLSGLGTNSFLGGQFIAEIFGTGMKHGVDFINMWSVVEGNSTALNIGYIDPSSGNKKPAYYHFQIMAQHMKGNFLPAVSTQTTVKVIASQNTQSTTLVILNEDQTTNFNYSVRLNTAAISGTAALKITVPAGIAAEYHGNISNQESIILVFDAQGNLMKKISYGLSAHAALNLAPTVYTYSSVPVVTAGPPINLTPASELQKCSGNTRTLTVGNSSLTSWYTSASGSIVIATGSTCVTPVLTTTGNVSSTYTYYAANTSVAARTPISFTVWPLPTVFVNSGTICSGKTFTLISSGASSYSYSSGSAFVSPSLTSTYSVYGLSENGCRSSLPALSIVTVSTPVMTVNSGAICKNSSFILQPSGAVTYTYSSGSATVMPKRTATYTVTGTNAQGCVANAVSTVTILKPSECSLARVHYPEKQESPLLYPVPADMQSLEELQPLSPSFLVTDAVENGKTNALYETHQESEKILCRVFPNPTNGEFQIQAFEMLSLEILSQTGSRVYQRSIYPGSNTLALQELPSGLYLLKFRQGDRLSFIRMIKN